jgi:hypothetical protein
VGRIGGKVHFAGRECDKIATLELKLYNAADSSSAADMSIYLIWAAFSVDLLKEILINGCRIFTGKEPSI